MSTALATVKNLDRVLGPVVSKLPREAVEALANLKADSETQARLDILADGNNAGTLTAAEHAEHEGLVHAAAMLSVLKTQAMLALQRRNGTH